ncbi:hypothetical protein FHEFKHOI_01143 [Candidatus Methanoperedenaceae archaeon GB50]|nr:hypothetical protein FHEFKHOI_01143 [Candidatus Methanoperedenaceae archaeon GB50]CAD7776525.1 MAG: hypothetical protein KBONHNOK_00925 [Candidatus Methanoperedenaceae archaeon GB50]
MKNEPKKEIWEEIVISNLETQNGKIKVIMDDAGFLAYNNILLPLNCRTIPLIKVKSNIDVKKLKKRIENHPANLFWLDSKYNKNLSSLLKDFSYAIKQTVEGINKYEEFTETRSRIESFFKIA